MRSGSPSILYRIVGLHVVALGGITIAVTAAAYFLLNSTVNDFENRILRDHAATCRILSGIRGWPLVTRPAARSSGDLYNGLWRICPGGCGR